jgi:hypothetical protein
MEGHAPALGKCMAGEAGREIPDAGVSDRLLGGHLLRAWWRCLVVSFGSANERDEMPWQAGIGAGRERGGGREGEE